MDWEKRKERLRRAKDFEPLEWFNPEAGEHKLTVVAEGGNYEVEVEDKATKKLKRIERIRLEIEKDGKKKNWGVSFGQTENSLYGQLCLLGASHGTLVGQPITLLVKGQGKNKEYTITEALPLMSKEEEKVA